MIGIKTQLSVVIENKPGVLTRICDALASHHINIEGFSAYGERDHGIVRLVTSDPERAASILSSQHLVVTQTSILAARLANRPAGLMRLARRLADNRINIDYAYGSAAASGRMAVVYLRVTNVARACAVLNAAASKKRATRKKKTDTSTGKITKQKKPARKKTRRASKTPLVRRVGRR